MTNRPLSLSYNNIININNNKLEIFIIFTKNISIKPS